MIFPVLIILILFTISLMVEAIEEYNKIKNDPVVKYHPYKLKDAKNNCILYGSFLVFDTLILFLCMHGIRHF